MKSKLLGCLSAAMLGRSSLQRQQWRNLAVASVACMVVAVVACIPVVAGSVAAASVAVQCTSEACPVGAW